MSTEADKTKQLQNKTQQSTEYTWSYSTSIVVDPSDVQSDIGGNKDTLKQVQELFIATQALNTKIFGKSITNSVAQFDNFMAQADPDNLVLTVPISLGTVIIDAGGHVSGGTEDDGTGNSDTGNSDTGNGEE